MNLKFRKVGELMKGLSMKFTEEQLLPVLTDCGNEIAWEEEYQYKYDLHTGKQRAYEQDTTAD
jgi:hypothetical protein